MPVIYDLPCPYRTGLHYLWHEGAPVIFLSYYEGGDYCDCKNVIYLDTIIFEEWIETEKYIEFLEKESGSKRRNLNKLKFDKFMKAAC